MKPAYCTGVCRTVPCLDSRSGRSYTCETTVIGAHFKVNCALLGANNDTVILTIQGHKCSELYNIELFCPNISHENTAYCCPNLLDKRVMRNYKIIPVYSTCVCKKIFLAMMVFGRKTAG